MNRSIVDTVNQIDEILLDATHQPLDKVGSRIVGVTIAQEGTDTQYAQHPLLEDIAELAADLETLGGSGHEGSVFLELTDKFQQLKAQLNDER